jgi:hypothetical protein
MKVKLLSIVVAAALVTTAAACGGGKKSPTTTSTTSAAAFASKTNCARMRSLAAKVSQSLQFSAASANAQAAIANEAAQLQALVNAAPAQIRGDLQTFATAFDNFLRSLNEAGLKAGKAPTAAQIAKLRTAVKALATPKLRAAEQHLAAWERTNCRA